MLKNSSRLEIVNTSPNSKHFVVVKITGRPDLMGLSAYEKEVIPVTDFYEGM